MSKEAILDIPIDSGIDESIRSELLDARASFSVLENGRWPTQGGYAKRNAFAARSSTRLDATVRAAGRKVIGRRDETCVIDGHYLDSWSPTFGLNTSVDRVPELACERFAVCGIPSLSDITLVDADIGFAYANGCYWILYLNEAVAGALWQLNVLVVDASSRAIIARHFNIAGNFVTPAKPEAHICAFGNTVVVAWASNNTTIRAATFDATSAATVLAGPSASVALTAAFQAGFGWDIAGLETSFALAYVETNSGINVARFNAALAAITSGTPVPVFSNANFVAIDGSEGDLIWLAWTKTTDASCYITGVSPANTANVTSTTAAVLTGLPSTATPRTRPGIRRTSATGGYVVARGDMTGFGGWLHMASREFTTAVGVTSGAGTQNILHGWTPHTQPFVLGGRAYALAVLSCDSAAPANMVAFDITAYTGFLRPCASPATGVHYYNRSNNIAAQHIVQRSATKVAALIVTKSSSVDAAIEIVEFDCTSTHRWQPVEHNGVTYLSGGQMYGYDGTQLFEANFVAPPSLRVSKINIGAGTIISGTYSYTAIVEWTDAEGNVHWSEPAVPQTTTITGGEVNANIDVEILGYASTWRDSVIGKAGSTTFELAGRIKVFRTKNGGESYYLVATYPLVRDLARYSTTDSSTDANIASHAQLYTVYGKPGAALVRRTPPACVDAAQYNGQIAVIAEDRQTIWMSGSRVVGEGLWFNPVWQTPTDDDDLIAIRAQDGTFFAWSRSSIFAVVGDPPSDNGTIGGLGQPRRLACDVGCINPNSLVVTNMGIFFQSERGIELLTRAQTVADPPIGLQVQESVAAFPICKSATLDAAEGLVYFEMVSAEVDGVASGTGRALVYDILRHKWVSTDRRFDSASTPDAPAQSAAMVYDPAAGARRYSWLAPDGTLYVEDQSSGTKHLDPGGNWIKKRAKTPWIHAAGTQGEQSIDRIMLLADKVTDHDLTITIYFDYDEAISEVKPFTAAQLAALTRQWIDKDVTRSTNTAFRVMVEDAMPSSGVVGTGEGATWIELAFPGIPHRGVKRTSAAQRGG